LEILITSFEKSAEDIRHVRDAVFGQEQQVSPDLDWDGQDPDSTHVLATDKDGNAIGTGRMLADGKIGRLAVLKQWRGQGLGAGMLDALVELAGTRGFETVRLHAQVQAMAFYQKNGFKPEGPEFLEADIRHIKMTRSITASPGHHVD
jgi:predicted GNAT family N-acyltransferase